MGKDSVNISAAATVLHEAAKKVHEYPSSADDKLTAERTSKHFCQHVINHRCGWHLSVLSLWHRLLTRSSSPRPLPVLTTVAWSSKRRRQRGSCSA